LGVSAGAAGTGAGSADPWPVSDEVFHQPDNQSLVPDTQVPGFIESGKESHPETNAAESTKATRQALVVVIFCPPIAIRSPWIGH